MITSIQTHTGETVNAFWDGTEHRFLGRIRTNNPKLSFSPFSEYLAQINAPVLDISHIPAYDRYQTNVPILDQKRLGACCGHSYTTLNLKARDQAGQTLVLLSADSLYAQVNGGRDGGSDPADVVTALEQNGECTLAEVPDEWVLWGNVSASAKQNALRFRLLAAGIYSISSFAELVTADYLGFSTAFTINVGNNFGPGSDGVVGFAPGQANHCVAGGEGLRIVNGVPQYRFRNSWNTSWGTNGCAWITQEHIDKQVGVEAHALMWVPEDPNDITNIPKEVS